jgi:hypothetical protein
MKLDFLPYDLKLNHTWAIARSAVTGGGSDVASVVLGRLSNRNGASCFRGAHAPRVLPSAPPPMVPFSREETFGEGANCSTRGRVRSPAEFSLSCLPKERLWRVLEVL